MISDEYSALMTETDADIPEVHMYDQGVVTGSLTVEVELLHMTEEEDTITVWCSLTEEDFDILLGSLKGRLTMTGSKCYEMAIIHKVYEDDAIAANQIFSIH